MRSHWVFPFVLTAAACGGSGATHEPPVHANPPAPEQTESETSESSETSSAEETPAAPEAPAEAAPGAATPEVSE